MTTCPNCQDHIKAKAGKPDPYCPKCRFPVKLLAGVYRLESKLGVGGFGVVYLARHIETHEARAIKLLRHEIFEQAAYECIDEEEGLQKQEELLSRFKREIRVTQELTEQSPHIVQLYDLGEDKELGHYYIMEYLQGDTLQAHLREGVPFPQKDSFHIFEQICRATASAHSHGIVHRDLKPDNVFLLPQPDKSYYVKIIDFGIAKSLFSNEQLTRVGGVLGSAVYISPEQVNNSEVSKQTDIYMLGGMFYRLLTGTPPFTKKGPSLLMAHLTEAIQPMSERCPEMNIPKELDAAVLKALSKDPKERYEDVESFWQAVAPFSEVELSSDAEPTTSLKIRSTPRDTSAAHAGTSNEQTWSGGAPPVIQPMLTGDEELTQPLYHDGAGRREEPSFDENEATFIAPPGASIVDLHKRMSQGVPLFGEEDDETIPPLGEKIEGNPLPTSDLFIDGDEEHTYTFDEADSSIGLVEHPQASQTHDELDALGEEESTKDLRASSTEPRLHTLPEDQPQPFVPSIGAATIADSSLRPEDFVRLAQGENPSLSKTIDDDEMIEKALQGKQLEFDELELDDEESTLRLGNVSEYRKRAQAKADIVVAPSPLPKENRKTRPNSPEFDEALRKAMSESQAKGVMFAREAVGESTDMTAAVKPQGGPLPSVEMLISQDEPEELAGRKTIMDTGDRKIILPPPPQHTMSQLEKLQEDKASAPISDFSFDDDEDDYSNRRQGKSDEDRLARPVGHLSGETYRSPEPPEEPPRPSRHKGPLVGLGVALLVTSVVLLIWRPWELPVAPKKKRPKPPIAKAQKKPRKPTKPPKPPGPPPGTQKVLDKLPDATMVWVPRGEFMLGSPASEIGRYDNEGPQTKVKLTRGFWIWSTEVTQAQYQAVMKKNPSEFKRCGPKCPVERVSWFQALQFANRLSKLHGLPRCYICGGKGDMLKCGPKARWLADKGRAYYQCKGYRLPTEAEWVYAARAGSTGAIYSGTHATQGKIDTRQLKALAWFQENSDATYKGAFRCTKDSNRRCGTHPAKQKKPNAWGLYDLLGNVWEWCYDWYTPNYPGGTVTNPVGGIDGKSRVGHGGSWHSGSRLLRISHRGRLDPRMQYSSIGFRLVRSGKH